MALAALAAAGSVAAATRPAVSLSGGQIRWFLPGALQTGDTVRCVVHGDAIRVKIRPPSAGISGVDFAWKRGGTSVQIARRTNGSTEIACGTMLASPIHRANMPYVIGQNGLGLIRGPNRLDRLERLFGAASTIQSGAALCTRRVELDRAARDVCRRAVHEREHASERNRARREVELARTACASARRRRRCAGSSPARSASRPLTGTRCGCSRLRPPRARSSSPSPARPAR